MMKQAPARVAWGILDRREEKRGIQRTHSLGLFTRILPGLVENRSRGGRVGYCQNGKMESDGFEGNTGWMMDGWDGWHVSGTSCVTQIRSATRYQVLFSLLQEGSDYSGSTRNKIRVLVWDSTNTRLLLSVCIRLRIIQIHRIPCHVAAVAISVRSISN